MIRIIQLSDFHINPKNLDDWKSFIKKALIEKLKELNANGRITFIAFTGDMIDKGGKSFESATKAFEIFNEDVINPIVSSLGITVDKFLIVPGNHDVVRDNDSERDEMGSKNYFSSLEKVTSFMDKAMKNGDFDGMKRMIEYKKFEEKFYKKLTIPNNITIFGSSFILEHDTMRIGIACFNSAWRCYDDNDSGNLLIGEKQLVEHTNFIEKTDLKVALVHHPIDTLSKVESKLINRHLHKDYDILLFGDAHETNTLMSAGFTGSLFVNLAPSGISNIRSDSRKYSNGFTVIDVNLEEKQICAQYFRYNHDKKSFVINTDAGNTDDGKFCQNIPDKKNRKSINIINKALDNIRDNHYKTMNDYMIGVKVDINVNCLKDAFVLPPITQGKSLSDDDAATPEISISKIVKSDNHQMFFGNKESGKTVLLYRLVMEYVDEYQYSRKIPIYLNLDEIGNKELDTVLKNYLSFTTRELNDLLKNNDLVLLVDNLNYKYDGSNIERLKKVEKYVEEHSSIRILATGDGDISTGIPPIDYVTYCKIPFKSYFIQNLRSKEIKSIIKLWVPEEDDIKLDDRLDKLVSDFSSFSLPSNAMSISLFLWSTEYSDRKPINNAVLLDIYIEIILEKLNQDNIYRGSFDFTNKLQLLAKIAQEMLISEEDNYSLVYSDYVKVIESYLNELVGFDYEVDKIAEYFLKKKIFCKYQGNRVKFAYSCFFHFFLAKRMKFNPDFKDFVLSEKNYCKYIFEIDFYTGLARSDKNLLKLIFKRFQLEFQKTDSYFEQLEDIWDRFFIIKSKDDIDEEYKFVSKAKTTEISQIKENRPSQEMIDEFQNRRLSKIGEPGRIFKKNGGVNLETLLILMSVVLRNSEGVEDLGLKKEIYNSIVKYSLIWTVLYREHIVEYIVKYQKLPPTFPTNISVQRMLTNLPLHVQGGMSKWMGTKKLSKVILNKINSDSNGNSYTNSDIEAFFSVALYADIQGRDYPKYYNNFIKKLKNTPVRDYAFYKLIYYYYRRTRDGSPNEEIYLDMISEMKMKELNMPNRMKQQVKERYRKAKKRFGEA